MDLAVSTYELMVLETKIFKIHPHLPILGHFVIFVHMIPVKMRQDLEWPITDGFSIF